MSPTRAACAARRSRGYTLIELVLVAAIVAAAYALASRAFFGTSGAELRAASRSVAAGLRQARTLALHERREAALQLDLERRTLEVPGSGRAIALPAGLEIKLYTARSEIVAERAGAIRFFPDGSSTGGRVTLGAGKRRVAVDVDWLTGKVSIQ